MTLLLATVVLLVALGGYLIGSATAPPATVHRLDTHGAVTELRRRADELDQETASALAEARAHYGAAPAASPSP